MRLRFVTILLPVVLAASLSAGTQTGYAQSRPGPTLTVIGFALANLPPSAAAATPQLELSLRTSAIHATSALQALQADVARLESALRAAGVPRSEIAPQGPPGLNYVSSASQVQCDKTYRLKNISGTCLGPGFQAYVALQVSFGSLSRLAAVVSRPDVTAAAGVQNFFINQAGSGFGAPSGAALTAAYRRALGDAQQTARLMARADHLVLGAAVSVTQGALLGMPCGGMGCSPTPIQGINAPQPGPNQELIAVTVAYRTSK